MLCSGTPLRVSFFGAGTNCPEHFERNQRRCGQRDERGPRFVRRRLSECREQRQSADLTRRAICYEAGPTG
jgi:hypothetical protein